MKIIQLLMIFGLIFESCSSDRSVLKRSLSSIDSQGNWSEVFLWSEEKVKSNSCKNFYEIAVGKENKLLKDQKLKNFKTDGIVVIKDGKLLWEWYDSLHTKNTPHVLWSASKTFTTSLIGRAVHEGQIDLSTTVDNYFLDELNLHKSMIEITKVSTVGNLVEMNYPFKWNEFYESKVENSTFLPMLYLQERFNMVDYILSQPRYVLDKKFAKLPNYALNPGQRNIYSGGASNLLQHILRKTYGSEYHSMPWSLLFNEIGMKDVRWERDETGLFVGSSYLYSTPREMAKYGLLYLNDGVWNGKRLLPEGWVKSARTLSQSMTTSFTGKEHAITTGMQSEKVFWLNKDIIRSDSYGESGIKKGGLVYAKEFPNVSENMYFTAGHYGQLIVMLPDENIVIARTGHDLKYWNHLDPFISSAVKCFK